MNTVANPASGVTNAAQFFRARAQME